MSRSNFYKNYYQSFMNENMNPLYRRYLEYLSSDLPDISNIGGFIDVPATNYDAMIDSSDLEPPRQPTRGPMAPIEFGGGGEKGIGAFKNLDKDSVKYFKDKYGNIIKGYRNINSGLFQTEDGQNIIGLDEYESISSGSIDRPYGVPDMIGSSTSPSVIAAMTNVPSYGLRSLNNPFDLQAKQIFAKNLAEKQAQEEAEKKAAEIEKAKKAMIEKIKQENQKPGEEQGGYQSDFSQDKEFMEGPKPDTDRPGGGGYGGGKDLGGGGGSPGSSGPGGSDTMGSF